MLEGLFQTLAESQQRIEQLETAVDQLIRQRTGPKSERCHADQLTLFDGHEEEESSLAEPPARR